MRQTLLKYRLSFARPLKEKGIFLLYYAVSGAERFFRQVVQISVSIMPVFVSLMVPSFYSLRIKELPPPLVFERENPMVAYSFQYSCKASYPWQKHFYLARRNIAGQTSGMFVWERKYLTLNLPALIPGDVVEG